MQTKGNVVIVGVLDVYGSTNIYMAKAFEKAGYNVIPVNYRTIHAEHGPNTLKALLWKLAKSKPELMLFSKCNALDPVIVGKCGQETKTWFWFMDGMKTLSTVPECLGHAQLAEYTSCTGLGVANFIKKELGGDDKVFHIMEGVDLEVYRPTVVRQHLVADVSFIGTANSERIHYLNVLGKDGWDVAAYGNGFNQEVHGSQFNSVCSSSQAMIALSVEHDTSSYFSDRIFRYGACGSFVLHKYSPGMEKYFVHGQDIVYYTDDESLRQMAREYLGPGNQNKRSQIASNLYLKVIQTHTWDNVVAQITNIAEI